MCRIIGDLYLSAEAQKMQFQQILDKLNEKVAGLEKENRQLKEQCTIPKEKL